MMQYYKPKHHVARLIWAIAWIAPLGITYAILRVIARIGYNIK